MPIFFLLCFCQAVIVLNILANKKESCHPFLLLFFFARSSPIWVNPRKQLVIVVDSPNLETSVLGGAHVRWGFVLIVTTHIELSVMFWLLKLYQSFLPVKRRGRREGWNGWMVIKDKPLKADCWELEGKRTEGGGRKDGREDGNT